MSRDEAWQDVTPDYFDAVPSAGGVAVRMGANVAATLHHHADRLVRALEEPGDPDEMLARLFGDAYPDRAASQDFRRRQARWLRDSSAPRRVRDQLAVAPNHVLSPPEVDDWLVTFALARFVDAPPRRRRRRLSRPVLEETWFNHVQESLVLAAHPELLGENP